MADTETTNPTSTGAEDVAWDIGTLVDGEGADGVRRLLARGQKAEFPDGLFG